MALSNQEMKAMLASVKLSDKTRAGVQALLDSGPANTSSGMMAGVAGLLQSVETKEDFLELLKSLEG
jgi:hypothetical protein